EDVIMFLFFFSSRRRHTRSYGDWSSDVCSSDLRELEVERGHNDELQLTPDGKTMVFTRVSIQHPNEVYKMEMAAGQHGVALSHMNDAIFAQVHTSPLEPFWFTGSENKKVEGFIVKPPAFDAKKKYPVKFLIHGGPQGAWDDSWTFRWNAQM